jgi:predicted nucleotidyltransferase
MKVADELVDKREEILRLAAKHGAGNIAVFGSVACHEETAGSDLDLLIDVTGETTPWFPGGLAADLEELLGRRVQIVIRRSLSPLIRDSVLKDARPL